MSSVEKKITKSVVYQFFNFLFSGLVGILFIPFIINNIGASRYGLFEIVFSLNIINAVLDLGIGSTIVNYTDKYLKQGKLVFTNFFWSYFWLKFFLSILGVFLCLIIAYNVHFFFNQINIEGQRILKLSIQWFAIGVIIQNINSFITAIQNGFVRFDLSSSASIISKIFYILIFFIWWYGVDIHSIIGFSFITFVLVPTFKLIIQIAQVRKLLISNLCGVSWGKKVYILDTFNYLKGISIITIFGQLFNYGSQFLLSVISYPEIVGQFGILKRIVTLIQTISSMIIRPILPAAQALKDNYSLSKIILTGTQFHAIVIVGLNLLVIINAQFINIYFFEGIYNDFSWTIFLICAPSLLPSFSIMLMIYYSEGKVKMSVQFNVLNTVFSLLFAYVGYLHFKLEGFLIGLSLGYTLILIFQVYRYLKLFAININKFLRIYLYQFINIVLVFSLNFLLEKNIYSFLVLNITSVLILLYIGWISSNHSLKLIMKNKLLTLIHKNKKYDL
ncbi:MAG: lipopolysaccharide biosynthesis protein [Polaribacter sp.]